MWPRVSRCLFLALLFTVVLLGCRSSPPTAGEPSQPVVVRVTGSEEMVPLMVELAAAYEAERANVFVDVSGGGSRWGLRALLSGQADIGMVSYEPSEEELKSGRERLITTELGRDGLAIIVHPSNPLFQASQTLLADIFSGTVFRWEDLGWEGGEIAVLTREPGSGDRRLLEAYLFDAPQLRMTLNAMILPTPDAMLQAVAEAPTAIGYVSTMRFSGAVKALSVEGVQPTSETVADGTYPLTRPLLLVTRGRPRGPARDFLNWATSPAGQAIVARFAVPVRR